MASFGLTQLDFWGQVSDEKKCVLVVPTLGVSTSKGSFAFPKQRDGFGRLAVHVYMHENLTEGADPLRSYAGVLTIMLLALLASALPATRAASADPIDALRSI